MSAVTTRRGSVVRRLGLTLGAVAAVAVLTLGLGHAGGSNAGATNEGVGEGTFIVRIGEVELDCLIRITLSGEGGTVTAEEGSYFDNTFVGDGQCPIGEIDDPTAEVYPVDDLVQTLEGTFDGTIAEKEPNGNGLLDGFAEATFEIHLVAETTDQGTLQTEEQVPITIECPNMDMRTRPATYDCQLRAGDEVELFGSESTVMLVALDLTFEEPGYVPPEAPRAGFGVGSGGSFSPLTGALVAALAGAGVLLFLGGGLLAMRRR